MAKLKILRFPDPRLRQQALPVKQVDAKIKQIISDMLETMYAQNGIGLAAIQVNIIKRIIVIDISEQRDQPLCLINPEIILREGHVAVDEGCLSVPNIYERVDRANKIKIKALNEHGEAFELEADDILSICIQHEIDHLDGKLFVDYLSQLKRQRIRKKMEKLDRQQNKIPAKNRRLAS